MKETQLPNRFFYLFHRFQTNRKFAIVIIILVVFSVILSLGLISIFLSFLEIPDFDLRSFSVTKIEKNNIYANLSITLSEPLTRTISIKEIVCQLYQENHSNLEVLAEGKTLSAIRIHKEKIIIKDLLFVFEVPNLENLFNALFSEEKIGIKGKMTLPFGFITTFHQKPKEIKYDFFPMLSVYEIFPISPGSQLKIITIINNSHNIPFNLTQGEFELFSENYGVLGNVSLTNISMIPGLSNVSMLLQSNIDQLAWMFESVLNNGSIQAQIRNFRAVLKLTEEEISVCVNEGPHLLWCDIKPGIQVYDLSNIDIDDNLLKFDVNLGFLGKPLWGYNITPCCGRREGISFDFFHKLLDNESQIVGNGSTNVTISVNRLEQAYVDIHVNIFPSAAVEMISSLVLNKKIEIDIRNGILCLQFYEISFQVRFEYRL